MSKSDDFQALIKAGRIAEARSLLDAELEIAKTEKSSIVTKPAKKSRRRKNAPAR